MSKQQQLLKYLESCASNEGITLGHALVEVLGDLQIVAKEQGLDFDKALEAINTNTTLEFHQAL